MNELKIQKKVNVTDFVKYSLMGLLAVMLIYVTGGGFGALAFADQANASDVIQGVMKIIFSIASIVGILLTVLGIIRFVIAYANEQGPAQQQAIQMVAAGVILLLLGTIFNTLKPWTWFVEPNDVDLG